MPNPEAIARAQLTKLFTEHPELMSLFIISASVFLAELSASPKTVAQTRRQARNMTILWATRNPDAYGALPGKLAPIIQSLSRD